MFGQLIPVGGGDPIPLLKKSLLVGRRESCDIVLRFPNVSAHHCELTCTEGYWFVRDLDSRNGVKVNGVEVFEKRIDPGDVLAIASHKYQVQYSPEENGATGTPPPDPAQEDILGKSLLERAGLERDLERRVQFQTRSKPRSTTDGEAPAKSSPQESSDEDA